MHETKGGLDVCVWHWGHTAEGRCDVVTVPVLQAAVWHTEMKDLAQGPCFKESLQMSWLGSGWSQTPARSREAPSPLRHSALWFGFTDIKANIFSNWNLFGSWCVESYKCFICAGLEEKTLWAVDCLPHPQNILFIACNIETSAARNCHQAAKKNQKNLIARVLMRLFFFFFPVALQLVAARNRAGSWEVCKELVLLLTPFPRLDSGVGCPATTHFHRQNLIAEKVSLSLDT